MAKKSYQEIGIVREIYRYPVKSMAGELLESSWVGWHGLEGDRRYAFMKQNSKRGFPWLTMRDIPDLILFRPYYTKPDSIRESEVRVKIPDDSDISILDPKLIEVVENMSRYKPQLVHLWSGIYDSMDLSIITSRSITSISSGIDFRRFRANIVIDVAHDIESNYPEDKWLKNLLIFGEGDDAARIKANRKDPRCMAVNLDPNTSEQQPDILKQIVNQRKNLLGIYGSIERPGSVRLGDKVFLVNS